MTTVIVVVVVLVVLGALAWWWFQQRQAQAPIGPEPTGEIVPPPPVPEGVTSPEEGAVPAPAPTPEAPVIE